MNMTENNNNNQLDSIILDVLGDAIYESKIINHFQYGHNLLQSTVQIDELFSMLDTIIKKVLNVVGDLIPDINLAPYKDGLIDSTRANLCWVSLDENYYGIMLNTHKGTTYRPFTESNIKELLMTGQFSSWYLVSKIQNLSYLIAKDNANKEITVSYFRQLIIDIIERYFKNHETSTIYHPSGMVGLADLDDVFIRMQSLNTRSIVPAASIEAHEAVTTSQSLIKTLSGTICWQYFSDIHLVEMNSKWAEKILSSKYLNKRSDVEAFLEETFVKRNGKSTMPNEYCYISYYPFNTSYVDLNYVVECQLRGYVEVEYDNGEIETVYPDTQPFVIQKGKNDIYIMTVIKLNTDITKSIKGIVNKKSVDENSKFGADNHLEHMKLICSCTGVSKRNEDS